MLTRCLGGGWAQCRAAVVGDTGHWSHYCSHYRLLSVCTPQPAVMAPCRGDIQWLDISTLTRHWVRWWMLWVLDGFSLLTFAGVLCWPMAHDMDPELWTVMKWEQWTVETVDSRYVICIYSTRWSTILVSAENYSQCIKSIFIGNNSSHESWITLTTQSRGALLDPCSGLRLGYPGRGWCWLLCKVVLGCAVLCCSVAGRWISKQPCCATTP